MIDLQLSVQEELPRVWCDRAMIEQVILNLARNGMQAMDRPMSYLHKKLELTIRETLHSDGNPMIMFEVVDLGSGIDQEVELNLYTPFFTTKAEGMGLGLSLCRTVVEQHGGRLSHRPNHPCGTVFTFTLSCRPASATLEV